MAYVMSFHILLDKASYMVNCKIIVVENYTSPSGNSGCAFVS